MPQRRILIMGAAGRDFHNFNTLYRGDPEVKVVAFTAAQIPDIDGRRYPPELAGEGYPEGIPIESEDDLEKLIHELQVDEVIFAYSDIRYEHIGHCMARANAAGAHFTLPSPTRTMIKARVPVVAITAVRTGVGKSQTTRAVCDALKAMGKRVVAIRHPMPYGDLLAQRVQRFASYADLDSHDCTIEEREEYEPHIDKGIVVFAGVDYEAIVREAEKEADIIVWDGGNNDTPFYVPDLHITLVDPHRPGHEMRYFPGETNLRMSSILIINKVDTADPASIQEVRETIARVNPGATIIEADSPFEIADAAALAGKRVLVVEDGPTLTHGEMKYGAAYLAAKQAGAAELVDPRPYLKGTLKDTFAKYPDIGTLLPAMGYGKQQMQDLQDTIDATDCDVVAAGTPIDLTRIISPNKPIVRISYRMGDKGRPELEAELKKRFA